MKNRRTIVSIGVAASLVSMGARAEVNLSGDWPKEEAKISLEWDGDRAGAVKELARLSKWNLVASGESDPSRVSIHVKEVAPSDILHAIYDGSPSAWDAKRAGSLIILKPRPALVTGSPSAVSVPVPAAAPGPVPATPPGPKVESDAASPSPVAADKPATEQSRDEEGDGPDRSIKGGATTIEKGERVHDVSVLGGSVDVHGDVTGDLVVVGGRVRILEGGRIKGDALAIGGAIEVEKGGRIEGEAHVIGGAIRKFDGAVVNGKTHHGTLAEKVVGIGIDEINAETHKEGRKGAEPKEEKLPLAERVADSLGHGLSLFSLLFVFGSLAIASRREGMLKLRVLAAGSPARNMGVGLVATIGFVVALALSCITIVGIPLAIVGAAAGVLGLYVGIVAVLGLVGELLLRHRTKNEFAHLALGAGLFALITRLPYVGAWTWIGVSLTGVGVLIAARAARQGYAVPSTGDTPYRG